jgi:hypothetical protein
METLTKQELFKVYQHGKQIDGVFYNAGYTAQEVKKSLIEHDGYDPDITVIKSKG